MRNSILVLLLNVCALVSCAQRTMNYDNPYVESSYQSSYSNTRIERISIDNRETRVYISYNALTNDNISISVDSKMTLAPDARRPLKIVKWGLYNNGEFTALEFNNPYSTRSVRSFTFCLIFPSIPTNTQKVSIEENVSEGFFWRGVRLAGKGNNAGSETNSNPNPNNGLGGKDTHTDSGTNYGIDNGNNHNDSYANNYNDSYGSNHNDHNGNNNGGGNYNDNHGDYHNDNGKTDGEYGGSGSISPNVPYDAPFTVNASGSCFALNSQGYLATCYHVIEDARRVRIRGINGDFDHPVMAKVFDVDRDNDLAILQIIEEGFEGLGDIPYRIEAEQSEVGEEVFTLGYPLRAVMGDEIKLTNGVISACSGYMGDTTSYQLSATVQSGNSGCPVFSSAGSVIGVVNARLENIESASYAIKEKYLLALIRKCGVTLPTTPVPSMANEPMTTKVKKVKPFVYIVEVE